MFEKLSIWQYIDARTKNSFEAGPALASFERSKLFLHICRYGTCSYHIASDLMVHNNCRYQGVLNKEI
jgi:hypothetical protein